MATLKSSATTDQVMRYAAQNYSMTDGLRSILGRATPENFTDLGRTICEMEWSRNEWLSMMANKITRSDLLERGFENPLGKYRKPPIRAGQTAEQIYINIMEPKVFDPEGAAAENFKRFMPDVRAAYFSNPLTLRYSTTVYQREMEGAFLYEDSIYNFMNSISGKMMASAAKTDYDYTIRLITEAAGKGWFKSVNVPTLNAENSNQIITTIREYSNLLKFYRSDFNISGVTTRSDFSDQVLIMDAKAEATCSVNSFAMAFNLDYMSFKPHVEMIDNFYDLTGAHFALIDKEFFQIFPMWVPMMNTTPVGAGGYWNLHMLVSCIYAASPFVNAILFTEETPSITSVTVSPATAELGKGMTQNFTAVYSTTGYASQQTNWSISGNSDPNTKISPNGCLTLGADEAGPTITVTATSVENSGKSGTATVTVS